ncbi:MAG: hypothetical protein LBQ61_02525, partial [Spirochaetales bacterium]|nr:hypothetical protein [Spirochaetales bacterium]
MNKMKPAAPSRRASAIPAAAAIAAIAFLLALGACRSVPGDISSQDALIPNEGRQVPATLTLPAGKGPFPLVVFNHGFAGSRQEGGGFARLAEALAG